MKTWHLETRKIKDLLANPKNPRYIKKEMAQHLNDSIAKFGLIDKPIITNENLIIGGHQRVKILHKMKVKEIECWVCDQEVTQEEIDELMIGLNLHKGEFDFDILANQWDVEKLFEYGFTPEELLDVDVKEILNEDTQEDNDVLEPPKEPITKIGDIYELGNHRLMCGDSTNPDDVKALLNGNEPILMVTDPPYGIKMDKGFSGYSGFAGKGKPIRRRKYKNEWDNEIPTDKTFNLLMSYSDNAIIFGGNFFAHILPQSTHWLVWDKKNTMPTFGDCELIWTNFDRKSVKKYEVEWNGLIGKEENREHPTQKPVKILKDVIKDYIKDNQSIFDPFVGSGTTIIAAEKLNRVCYAMEIDPGYCDIAVARWEKLTGKKAKLIQKKEDI